MIPKWKDYAAWCAIHGLDPFAPSGGNFTDPSDTQIEDLYLNGHRYLLGLAVTRFLKDWRAGEVTENDVEFGHNMARWQKFFDS